MLEAKKNRFDHGKNTTKDSKLTKRKGRFDYQSLDLIIEMGFRPPNMWDLMLRLMAFWMLKKGSFGFQHVSINNIKSHMKGIKPHKTANKKTTSTPVLLWKKCHSCFLPWKFLSRSASETPREMHMREKQMKDRRDGPPQLPQLPPSSAWYPMGIQWESSMDGWCGNVPMNPEIWESILWTVFAANFQIKKLRFFIEEVSDVTSLCHITETGWWFGTFFIFPYIGNNHPNWLIFFRGVQTTNQHITEMYNL